MIDAILAYLCSTNVANAVASVARSGEFHKLTKLGKSPALSLLFALEAIVHVLHKITAPEI